MDWQTALAGRQGDSFRWKEMGWPTGGEKVAQALEIFLFELAHRLWQPGSWSPYASK